MIERLIRSLKGIFFKILFEFKTLSFDRILELVQITYNNRQHRSLFGKTPFECHFDSHVSSEVARRLCSQIKQRQKVLSNIFSLKKHQIFNVGDRVLLKRKRATFHKDDWTKHNMFDPSVREVTKVDKTCLPHLYSINDSDKKYYFFELKRVSSEYDNIEDGSSSNAETKIQVEDFVYGEEPHLRSGRTIANKSPIVYIIRRGEKTDRISADHLRFYKRMLGDKALTYSERFKSRPDLVI